MFSGASKSMVEDGRNGHVTEVFDMEGLLRTASPYQIHPVIVATTDAMEVVAGNVALERRTGYRASDLRGASMSRLFLSSTEFRNAAACIRNAYARGQENFFGYFYMRSRDGGRYQARLVVSFVRELRSGRVLAAIVVSEPTATERPEDIYGQHGLDLDVISHNLPGGLFQRVLRDGEVRYPFVRGQFLERLGLDARKVENDADLLLREMHEDDRWLFQQRLEESAKQLQPIDLVLRYRSRDGEMLRVRTLSQPRRLEDGVIVWDGIMLEVGDEFDATIRHQQLAYCDELTGLPNLSAFKMLLDALLSDAPEQARIVVAVNIKSMAAINQVMGVPTGNELIRQVADRLVNFSGSMQRVARAAHGDFLVCLDTSGDEEAGDVASKVLELFVEPLRHGDADSMATPVQVSVGLATSPRHGRTADDLLLNVETALGVARQSDSSDCAIYSDEIRAELKRAAHLTQELRAAIGAGDIVPHYQPQFDLKTGEVIGIEALARWIRPDGSRVPPDRFITLAEQAGLIDALGKEIFTRVIADMATWRQQHGQLPCVYVNVSGINLCDSEFESWYLEQLDRSGFDVGAIGIELTESMFLLNHEQAAESMHRLSRIGVKFSMDDFGTGYSSLSYLANLPFQMIKIDRSFVDGIASSDRKAALVDAIIRIGASLNLKVVAEGVETAGQVVVLRELGCRAAQGYYFCRPEPADAVSRLLAGEVPVPALPGEQAKS